MALIAPLRGLRYNQDKIDDMADVIAPPYDVISPAQQDEFYLAHKYNVIRLILPKGRPGDDEDRNRYQRAADDFKKWWDEDVLTRDIEPAIYLYQIDYPLQGVSSRLTRKGFISLLRLEDYAEGAVKPHEQTFSATKQDRLNLISICKANFSQIFTLYDDQDGGVMEVLEAAAPDEPAMRFEDHGGTIHSLWLVTDRQAQREVARRLRESTFYIADGHHRYETGLAYRDLMQKQLPHAPNNASFNYTLIYATAMQDKGLTILSANRLIKDLPGYERQAFLNRAAEYFDILELPFEPGNPAPARSEFCFNLAADGWEKHVIGFASHGENVLRILTLKDGVMDSLDLHPALKDLDVVVLNEIIYGRCLGLKLSDLDDEKRFVYDADLNSGLDRVAVGEVEMAFLLNPTRIEQVRAVANAGLIMPRKSTYFYPKVTTGLVMRPIVPSGVVVDPLAD